MVDTSISAALTESLGKVGTKQVRLARIHLTTGSDEGVDVHTYVSGDRSWGGYPNILHSVDPVSNGFDPLTLKRAAGDHRIVFEDGTGGNDRAVRFLLTTERLRNKLITIKLGTQELTDEADFLQMAKAQIVAGATDGKQIVFRALDAGGLLRETKIRTDIINETGYWVNRHPLEALEDLLVWSNVPTALYDATTLDPQDAAHADIAHWNLSRSNKPGSMWPIAGVGLKNPKNALELVNALCELIGGVFIPQNSGVFKFVRWAGLTGAVRVLDSSHFSGAIREPEIFPKLFNRSTIELAKTSEGYSVRVTKKDTDSITDHAIPGEAEGIIPLDKTSDFLNAVAHTRTQFGAGGEGTTFVVNEGGPAGFCGFRWPQDSGAMPAWAMLADPDRLLFIQVESPGRLQWSPSAGASVPGLEIMSIKQIDRYNASVTVDESGNHYYPNQLLFTVKARGLFGTAIIDWDDHFGGIGNAYKITDITIALSRAQADVEHWSYGCSELEVPVEVTELDLELADQVAVIDGRPVDFGKDGADTTTVYQIINRIHHKDRIDLRMSRVHPTFIGTVEDEPLPVATPAFFTDPLKVRSTGATVVRRSTGRDLYRRT